MVLLDLLVALTFLCMIACMVWRIACLFREKGNCRFHRCPFRKDYKNSSCLYFPETGCTKCPPTDEELEIYSQTPAGIIETLTQKKDD